MPRKRDAEGAQRSLLDVQEYLRTAPCVPALRQKVGAWREGGYPGATETTKTLLNWWFAPDHQLADKSIFAYHNSQREAIETLIYVYEVAKARTRQGLLQEYACDGLEIRLPPEDDFPRYCTTMATGSGKTKVMSLAIAWHYWNAVQGGDDETYARTFLIIAPNVIVLERLKTDSPVGASSWPIPSCRCASNTCGIWIRACAAIASAPTPKG
jgi:type III restriction enzyme